MAMQERKKKKKKKKEKKQAFCVPHWSYVADMPREIHCKENFEGVFIMQ